MSKTICINQSNYIPWRGYFDLIRKSDEFLIADSVQYTHKDWRNRNKIKTQSGPLWLTIPVESSGRVQSSQRIEDTRIADPRWADKHLKNFRHAYNKAPHFKTVMGWLEPLYREIADEPLLTRVNERLLRSIAEFLGLRTPLTRTGDYFSAEALDDLDRTERIIGLCRATSATRYLSGPAAKVYLDEAAMERAGIEVEWMDYAGYEPYPQLWGEFDPAVSIVDTLFCLGAQAGDYIGAGRPQTASAK